MTASNEPSPLVDVEGLCARLGDPSLRIIDARFEFADGLIRRHTDTFDLWRWSRLALGPSGLFLGWSPLVQNTIRDRARRGLEKWTADAAKRT